MHLLSLNKLALFDVSQAAIVGYIPTTGADTFFPAGGDCVVTGEAASRTLRRWELKTLRQQNMAVVDDENPLNGMLMGSGATSELIVCTRNGGTGVYNARTLRPARDAFDRKLQFNPSVMERISADGDLLLMAASYSTGGGGGRFELTVFEKSDSSWEVRYVPSELTWPVPEEFSEKEASVIIAIETPSGTREYQSFVLTVRPAT